MDYRKRAVEYKNEGHTFRELKDAFKIPPQTYYIWKERLESGYYETKVPVKRQGKIDENTLKQEVKRNPDKYLREFAELYKCTPQAIFYKFKKLGITYKKRHLPTQKNQTRHDKSS